MLKIYSRSDYLLTNSIFNSLGLYERECLKYSIFTWRASACSLQINTKKTTTSILLYIHIVFSFYILFAYLLLLFLACPHDFSYFHIFILFSCLYEGFAIHAGCSYRFDFKLKSLIFCTQNLPYLISKEKKNKFMKLENKEFANIMGYKVILPFTFSGKNIHLYYF